jgi:hypothetical protein
MMGEVRPGDCFWGCERGRLRDFFGERRAESGEQGRGARARARAKSKEREREQGQGRGARAKSESESKGKGAEQGQRARARAESKGAEQEQGQGQGQEQRARARARARARSTARKPSLLTTFKESSLRFTSLRPSAEREAACGRGFILRTRQRRKAVQRQRQAI